MRLIDADDLLTAFPIDDEPMLTKSCVRMTIRHMPTIEERKKGKWEITEAYPHNVYCSECHHKFAQTHWAVWEDGTLPRNYCPNCGADMRGGNDGKQPDLPEM